MEEKTILVRIPTSLKKRLKIKSAKTDKSYSQLVQEALEKHL